jgi:hypothetical protein
MGESKGLAELETFLDNLNLDSYREKYREIKIVEMDLPKSIWPLDSIYEVYWFNRDLLSYDDFYAKYKSSLATELKFFHKKIQMCKACFYLGLPARIYRTWTALLTQIHGGMVAEQIFGEGNVEMSTFLDQQGIDIKVKLADQIGSIQVKKDTQRKEARQSKNKRKIPGKHYEISYKVMTNSVRLSPQKKNGQFKKEFINFQSDYYKMLSNGFVLFTDKYFKEIRDDLKQRAALK